MCCLRGKSTGGFHLVRLETHFGEKCEGNPAKVYADMVRIHLHINARCKEALKAPAWKATTQNGI